MPEVLCNHQEIKIRVKLSIQFLSPDACTQCSQQAKFRCIHRSQVSYWSHSIPNIALSTIIPGRYSNLVCYQKSSIESNKCSLYCLWVIEHYIQRWRAKVTDIERHICAPTRKTLLIC